MVEKKELQNVGEQMPLITKEDVRKYFCQNATDKEVFMFLKIAQMAKLNPFFRELYLVKYGDAPAQIVTGYETYLKRAERSQQYAGFKVWTEGQVPDLKACIEVYRKDWQKPLSHEVEYNEYVQKTREGRPTRFWAEKPKTMLKKVCISQAMRWAFPDELAGMPYTQEEVGAESIQTHANAYNLNDDENTVSTTMVDEDTKEKQNKEVINDFKVMLERFKKAKALLGQEKYYSILMTYSYDHANQIKSMKEADEILDEMWEAFESEKQKLGSSKV